MKIREIAELVNGEVVGDSETEITGIAALASAKSGDISFFNGTSEVATNASCIFVPPGFETIEIASLIRVANPKLAFANAAEIICPPDERTGWHISAHIAPDSDVNAAFIGPFVSIGEGTTVGDATEIHAGSQIGQNVTLGSGTVIYPNCVIYDGTVIGENCVIHAGTVIGADGFGYVRDETGEQIKFPQVGTVVIEGNVEIGANSCIDRGSLGETRIGEGTKLDNLVQIAHNVQVGKHCIIAALTGISGSSILEDDVVLAGQVGIADHVTLKRGVVIGAKSAVFPNKIVHPGVWCGVPVQRIGDYKRQHAILKGVERLKDRIEEIERRLALANEPK